MKNRNKVIYWVFTLWACLGFVSTALVQILKQEATKATFMTHLGYPDYFLQMIGVWKILGVIALLAPGFPLVKEWAYAGFFFLMSGAVISHLAVGDAFKDTLPSLLNLTLIFVSWYFRPANRKPALAHQ
jgi:hypothetical protein